uniref:Uncharacterized protein MANES_15G027000 n=1 Tax=Rhizophora mucronata TaxID=61149 RepID=A0A2P2MKZ2_RHIMU
MVSNIELPSISLLLSIRIILNNFVVKTFNTVGISGAQERSSVELAVVGVRNPRPHPLGRLDSVL